MPLPPVTRFSAVDTKASPTNKNNGLYAPELSQAQIDAIPAETKHNGGMWYNKDTKQLEAVVDGAAKIVTTGGAGGGDVVGPGVSVQNNLTSFGDNTGKLIADSGIAKANVVTATAAPVGGKLVEFAGANKVLQETAVVSTNLVVNNGTAPEGNIAIFDGATGKIIKDSEVSIKKVPALAPSFRAAAFAMAPNVDINEISNLGHIRFTDDVGIIFVDTLMPVEFITNNTGSEEQVCSLFTGGLPSSSTSPSALVELQSDSGALLLSRMTTLERDALSAPVGANGMLLFNTDTKTFDGFDGTDWRTMPLLNTDGTLTVADPLASNNAATKNYVDTAISSIPAGTITLTGNVTASGTTGSPITTTLNMTLDEINAPVNSLDLNNQNIVNLLDPVNAQDAATKAFVEAAVSGIPTATITLSGDVTGSGLVTSPIATTLALTLDQIKAPVADVSLNNQNITNLLDPTTAQQASTKNYVDTRNITLSGAVSGSGLLGTTISTVLANITTSQITDFVSAVTAFRLDQFAVPTANINLNNQKIINLATPTASTDGANKDYVDTRTITLSGAVTGSGALGTTISTTLTNINTSQITNFNAAVTAFRLDQFAAPTASLNLNSQKIINLATPTLTGDATNKSYVDSAIAASGFAPGLATYIVQTTANQPTNAQVLGSLTTGLLKNATGTGVLTIGVAGTDYYSPGNPTRILDNTSNFFIGTNAGKPTTLGTNNTGVGVNSMSSLSTLVAAVSNTGIGVNTLQALTSGNENFAGGVLALSSLTTGDGNIALGSLALRNLLASNDNLAIGRNAGLTFAAYTSCIFIGNLADTTASGLTNAIAIGYNAKVSASNCMVLGASGTSVGIGGITPNAQLQLPTTHANRKLVLYETANNDHQVDALGTAAGIFRFQLDATTSNYIFNAGINSTTSNELMRLTGIGNLLVGTTTESARIHTLGGVQNVAGEDTAIRASSTNTVKIELFSGGLWELRCDNSAGNFSILNRSAGATPQFTIDKVNNTIYIAKQSYASYYGTTLTGTTVVTAGTFVKLNWPTSISTVTNNYTFVAAPTGPRLVFNSAVTPQGIPQKISIDLTATHNGGATANEVTTFAIYKNGAVIATIRDVLAGGVALTGLIFNIKSISLSKITTISNTDYFEIFVTHSVSGRTINVTDFNVNISST